MPLVPGQFAQFGAFVFDTKQRVLTRNGEIVPLAPKDIELLSVLLENAGKVVERKEILERVWPNTFVEEANLSRHIFNLRQILSEEGQRSIDTIPKRGYRLVAPVHFLPAPSEQDTPSPVPDLSSEKTVDSQGKSALRNRSDSLALLFGRAVTRWQTWAGLVALIAITAATIGLTRAKTPRRISLAVLPVQNLTDDPGKDYICDGLAEELVAQIAMLNPNLLRVVPRTATTAYKTSPKKPQEIAEELDVEYLLETSLRESAGRFRITTKLIHFPDQEHIWIREFDQKPTDLIGMQDAVSHSVAKLLVDLLPRKR